MRDIDAGRQPEADDDVAELRWFGPGELPTEMAFPGQVGVLREWAGSKSPRPLR